MRTPIQLTPIASHPGHPDYQAIFGWPFRDEPFYEGQVRQLLEDYIPQHMLFSQCIFWTYRDPTHQIVGFGSLEFCDECSAFADGKTHCYIPVLGVNPTYCKRGHGEWIVKHLLREAKMIVEFPPNKDLASNLLFLDVYTANGPAINLYTKCGFTTMNPDAPEIDLQNQQPFFIMAKQV